MQIEGHAVGLGVAMGGGVIWLNTTLCISLAIRYGKCTGWRKNDLTAHGYLNARRPRKAAVERERDLRPLDTAGAVDHRDGRRGVVGGAEVERPVGA